MKQSRAVMTMAALILTTQNHQFLWIIIVKNNIIELLCAVHFTTCFKRYLFAQLVQNFVH